MECRPLVFVEKNGQIKPHASVVTVPDLVPVLNGVDRRLTPAPPSHPARVRSVRTRTYGSRAHDASNPAVPTRVSRKITGSCETSDR